MNNFDSTSLTQGEAVKIVIDNEEGVTIEILCPESLQNWCPDPSVYDNMPER